tara:strand:- start:226 stop:480 length:255 start_codon:yes stop_codon:yes gene_type:complete
MNIEDIPKGWWLNVTLMARKENTIWIVGVLREGKTSWITEFVKGDLDSSREAYKVGMAFIQKWREDRGMVVDYNWERMMQKGKF